MFAFQRRDFSKPLSSGHRFLQGYHRQKRDRRRCNSRGIPPQPPATKSISQSARRPVWRHVVTLHILVGEICITFFPFSCEACFLYLVLWLCEKNTKLTKVNRTNVMKVHILDTIKLFLLVKYWIKINNIKN